MDRSAITEAKDVRNDLADAVRGGKGLAFSAKMANLVLILVNFIFFVVGIAFAMGSAALLSFADNFYGNDVFKAQLALGLRLGLATGVFLVMLALLGCLATCRVSACGLAIYVFLLSTIVILQVTAATILFVFGTSIASMNIGGVSFRWENGTIKKEWHTRPAYVIEREALRSFLNDTYTDCCVPPVHKVRHCTLAQNLAGSCDGQTSKQFRTNLKNGIAAYAAPTAWGMLSFILLEIFILIVTSCVMWRICATPSNVQYKVKKGFSKIEMN
jgi:hypothetical protein